MQCLHNDDDNTFYQLLKYKIYKLRQTTESQIMALQDTPKKTQKTHICSTILHFLVSEKNTHTCT